MTEYSRELCRYLTAKCFRQKKECVQSLEMGACLACLRNGKESSEGGLEMGSERQELGGMPLEAMLRTLDFILCEMGGL